MLDAARSLPGCGELFVERGNRLHLLHRSIAEWLLTPAEGQGHMQETPGDSWGGGIQERKGHRRLADHIWNTCLVPWLGLGSVAESDGKVRVEASERVCDYRADVARQPPGGSFGLRYAVDHLLEADKDVEKEKEVAKNGTFRTLSGLTYDFNFPFRLSWPQTTLREKGFAGHLGDMQKVLSSASHRSISSSAESAQLQRLSTTALYGSDAWLCLPAQHIGRLNLLTDVPQANTNGIKILRRLHKEATQFYDGRKSLKPLGSTLKQPGPLDLTILGHTDVLSSILQLTLPDGRIVSGSGDKTLRIWNPSSGLCETVLQGHTSYVSSLLLLSDGRIVSGSRDRSLRIWNPSSGECKTVLHGHTTSVISLLR